MFSFPFHFYFSLFFNTNLRSLLLPSVCLNIGDHVTLSVCYYKFGYIPIEKKKANKIHETIGYELHEKICIQSVTSSVS